MALRASFTLVAALYIGSGNTKLPGDFSLGTGLHPEKAITQLHHRLFLGL